MWINYSDGALDITGSKPKGFIMKRTSLFFVSILQKHDAFARVGLAFGLPNGRRQEDGFLR